MSKDPERHLGAPSFSVDAVMAALKQIVKSLENDASWNPGHESYETTLQMWESNGTYIEAKITVYPDGQPPEKPERV